MALNQGTSYIDLRARMDQLDRDLKAAEAKAVRAADSTSKKISTRLGSFAKQHGKNIAAGVGATLAAGAAAGLKEMLEAEQVMAQTEARLKSTGGAAGVTAEEISTLAGNLGDLAGVDDEAVQSGQNLLLTFTQIRNETGKGNDIFDQATKTALDMSTALGTDMTASAMQLGKALNDPIRGTAALRRVGVSFTEEQQEQISVLVESGKTMEAQKLILKELQVEFGGAAKAAGKTTAGGLNRLKESALNAAGGLVESLMPTIEDATEGLQAYANMVNEANEATEHIEESQRASVRLILQLKQGLDDGTVSAEQYQNTVQALTEDESLSEVQRASLIATLEALNQAEEEGADITSDFGKQMEESGKKTDVTRKKIAEFADMTQGDLKEWKQGTVGNFNLVEGALDRLAGKHKVTADKILEAFQKALEAQKDFGKNWREVLDRAGENGEDFLKHIQEEYGAQAPQIIAALADSNDKDFRAIVRAWNQAEGHAESLANAAGRSMGEVRNEVNRAKGDVIKLAGEWRSLKEALSAPIKASVIHGVGTQLKPPSGGGFGPGMNLTGIGQRLQQGGYTVTGHSSFPPVGTHTKGSFHYMDRAIDVNAGAGESTSEKALLNALAAAINNAGIRYKELFYPAFDPVGGHQDHLHLAMDTGGWVQGPATVQIGNIKERVHFTPEGQGLTIHVHGDVYDGEKFGEKVARSLRRHSVRAGA